MENEAEKDAKKPTLAEIPKPEAVQELDITSAMITLQNYLANAPLPLKDHDEITRILQVVKMAVNSPNGKCN